MWFCVTFLSLSLKTQACTRLQTPSTAAGLNLYPRCGIIEQNLWLGLIGLHIHTDTVEPTCPVVGWVTEAMFWLRTRGLVMRCSDITGDPGIWAVLCVSAHWPGSISRQCAGSSPSVARLSMDNSSSFSSQPRSFLFLLEPIRASTEKAWALELRAAADRLLSLISLKSTRRGGGRGEEPSRSVQRSQAKQWKVHTSVFTARRKLTECPK